jgi:hypothetical protein
MPGMPMDPIPPEALLDHYPGPMRDLGERLRAIVRDTVPDILERVRPGWHLIGYDLPVGRRSVYFAYIAPEYEHVHLGFEHGWAMRDPHALLQGEGITKQVRWLTFRPGDRIDPARCAELLREAATVATMTRGERTIRAMDAET